MHRQKQCFVLLALLPIVSSRIPKLMAGLCRISSSNRDWKQITHLQLSHEAKQWRRATSTASAQSDLCESLNACQVLALPLGAIEVFACTGHTETSMTAQSVALLTYSCNGLTIQCSTVVHCGTARRTKQMVLQLVYGARGEELEGGDVGIGLHCSQQCRDSTLL